MPLRHTLIRTGTALGLAVAAIASTAQAEPASVQRPWIAAWVSSPSPEMPSKIPTDVRTYQDQTVRQTLRLQAGARQMRLKLTNELGVKPVHVGAVHVALCDANGALIAGDHAVTFSGRRDVVIPPGAPIFSDTIDLSAPAFADLAVSVYYPETATPAAHLARVFMIGPGDQGAVPKLAGAKEGRGPALLSEVEILPATASRVLVAVGDSITEGAGSTPNAHMNFPEQFARRLAQAPGGDRWSMVNAGISGNRILHDGAGPNTLARFDRDVLDVPGVTDVILLEGINDIGWSNQLQNKGEAVTAEDIIAADRQMIQRAHARGLKIYGATLTPFEGAVYYDAEAEQKRETVNGFIRSGAFDGVVDFDRAVQDPDHPLRYLPSYDHGDHLHPSDAGYTAMTAVIPFLPFTRTNEH